MKNLTTRVPNYMQIYFQYSTYQMTVGGEFVHVCERGRVKDFEQRSPAYNAVRYN